MMYISNYQWTTISTFSVIDNSQFLSTYLILCILVKYIIPYQTLYHSLLLQSASKQLFYIIELLACQLLACQLLACQLLACQLQSLVLSYDLFSSWAILRTSLFTSMIEYGREILNFELCKNSSFLLQIEAFKYIIQPHSIVIYPNPELYNWN